MCRIANIHVDGYCYQNGHENAKAGIGVWWGCYHPNNISEPLKGLQSDLRAQINSAIRGINQAASLNYCNVVVHTDSQYVIDSITKYVFKWQQNGWLNSRKLPVTNKDDFLQLLDVMKGINVDWVKVDAHSFNHGNEEAEKLARKSVDKFYRGDDYESSEESDDEYYIFGFNLSSESDSSGFSESSQSNSTLNSDESISSNVNINFDGNEESDEGRESDESSESDNIFDFYNNSDSDESSVYNYIFGSNESSDSDDTNSSDGSSDSDDSSELVDYLEKKIFFNYFVTYGKFF